MAGWGLLGAALAIAAGVLVLFGVVGFLSNVQVVMSLPIAVQETVLALWLIVRGSLRPQALGDPSKEQSNLVD